MKRIYYWYSSLSKRVQDSIIFSATLMGMISTALSIIGISLGDWEQSSIWMRIGIVFLTFLIICFIVYIVIGKVFSDSIKITIRQTQVTIGCGDIFKASGLRVIGCDTHFDTRVDDIVISKKSLHGQLFLKHSKIEELKKVIDDEAKRLGLEKNKEGLYDFPLGTIICYESSIDKHTYLMLAMTELNKQYEAHTNMVEFESMLMQMWKEISRVYAYYDVALPILGTGISRFDDGPKAQDDLLRCMLCTLNSSGVTLKSKVEIVIYGDTKEISLYEYKNLLNMIPRR